MAITTPLAVEVFADLLPVAESRFWLQESQEYSGLGSGQILAADLAPALFMAELRFADMDLRLARRIEALRDALGGSLMSLYLYDHRHPTPSDDPDGAIVAGSSPSIRTVGSNGRSLSLQGLPAGYRLEVGDSLAFDYGVPARRAYHRIVEAVTATGGGNTSAFEVRPHVRLGAAAGLPVTLVKPAMKCIVQPKGFEMRYGLASASGSLSVVQRL